MRWLRRASKRDAADLLNRSSLCALAVQANGSVLFVSPALCQLLELIGFAFPKEIGNLLPASEWDALRERATVPTQNPLTLHFRSRNGAYVGVNMVVECRQQEPDNIYYLWGQRSTQPIYAGGEPPENGPAVGAYTATLSHEVRTPVNAIIGLTELLEKTPLDPEQSKLTRTINGLALHLQELLSDVLDTARFSDKDAHIEPAPFDLRTLLQELVDRYALLNEHLKFELTFAPSIPQMLYGDAQRISQIITNLITNAVKNTPRGGITIAVRDLENSRDVQIEIKDSGVGMPEELQQRLFQPFERGKSARQTGYGLGLFITKRFVELHGGTISLFSQSGKGSSFVISLPLIKPDLALEKRPEEASTTNPTTPSQPAAEKKTDHEGCVLLVDDNRINLLVVRRFLNLWNCPCQEAHSGEEALVALESRAFSLILMDIRMPGMDGYETTRHIRARNDERAKTPVIALTASTEPGVKEQFLACGMNGYLFKPFQAEQLRSLVAQYVALPPNTTPNG